MAYTKEQLQIVEKELSKCKNLKEAFNYLENTFDLQSTKVDGLIVGPSFRAGMIKAIQMLNPPLKR
jgi:hypothetical protein